MDIEQAVNYVYKSYMEAKDELEWGEKDSQKRNPLFSRPLMIDSDKDHTILVTGSKGKGSVTNMISCILRSRYKVGMMTSPHITKFNERIKLDGEDINDHDFCNIMQDVIPLMENIQGKLDLGQYISPMGIQAAVAMRYFACNRADVCIYECGKGVQYDDVNNIIHAYAVINPIFDEHIRELGDTIIDIAKDKSHIIDGHQKCVYVAQQEPDVFDVIEERAKRYGVKIKRYGKEFLCENIRYLMTGMLFDVIIEGITYKDIEIPLLGEHQAKNFALAMCLCKDYMGSLQELKKEDVISRLVYHGRMERIASDPLVLLDACIHRENCQYVKKTLRNLNISQVTAIIGIPDDKDYVGVAKAISDMAGSIILTKSSNKHYIFSEIQKEKLCLCGIDVISTNNIYDALALARKTGKAILILGTTSLVSDVISNREKLNLQI